MGAMYIITVIPLGRGMLKEELTYFSPEKIPAGALVSVPVRNKINSAIVISAEDARNDKMLLRQLSFGLKKIANLNSRYFLSENFVETAKELASYYLGTTGAVIHSIVPKTFLKPAFEFGEILEKNTPSNTAKHSGKNLRSFERLALMDNFLNRLSFYRSLVRECFAKDQSVMIIAPTSAQASLLESELRRGIEQITFLVHPTVSAKKAGAIWQAAASETHPILIVGTGLALSVPRSDLGAIVVENETSRSFKTQARPFVDFRVAAEKLAEKLGIRFFVSAEVLRLETFERLNRNEFLPAATLRLRLPAKDRAELIDLKNREVKATDHHQNQPRKKAFSPITKELEDLIKQSLDKKEKTFLFVARRGLATETVCGDCGSILTCGSCSAPLVLHGPIPEHEHINQRENYFLCHHCGRRETAAIRCQNCFSWKLRPLGIGSEGVASELAVKFPSATIIRLDKDSAASAKTLARGISLFENTPGAILIGSERTLLSLRQTFQNSCVVSLDSLLSLPDFRINEKVFSILTALRELSEKTFLIQTRRPEYQVISFALKGDIAAFIKDEIKRRQQFFYPPWSRLIKITAKCNPDLVSQKTSELETKLSLYRPDIFPGFIEKIRGKEIINALIKLPQNGWPDLELAKILAALPPEYAIEVDPEDLL